MRLSLLPKLADNCKSIWRGSASGLLGLILLFLCSGRLSAADAAYSNPVLAGDHPDPSIIRVGNEFWATWTPSEWGPQFVLVHSTDLVNWKIANCIFPHRPAWAVGNFWAPEISEYKGRYAVYYVGRKRDGPLAVAVATSDHPDGPYIDHGPLVAQEDGSIDPAPATDENGTRYLIWKEDGNSRSKPTPIWAQPLDSDGAKLVGQPTELIRNDAPWEGGVVEGPFILRRGDWFYLFYSGNGCCGRNCHYAMGVARSHKLLGPWEKNPANPILAANQMWECPGHGSIVTDQRGRYWLLYHAYSSNGFTFTGREGMLDEVKFGADGWPTINGGQGPSLRALSPFGTVQQANESTFNDDFNAAQLNPGWQWPQDNEPICRLGHHHLLLHSGNRSTNLVAAMLARPTITADYTAETIVDDSHLTRGSIAGLCAFGDAGNNMGVGVSESHIIVWREDKGVAHQTLHTRNRDTGKTYFRLETRNGSQIHFLVSNDGKSWNDVGDVPDAKDLPPWDRSVRVALTVGGATDAEGQFELFSLKPSPTQAAK